MVFTLASYTSPTCGTATIPLTHFNAFSTPSLLVEKMLTSPKLPTSSMLIVVPVSFWISCITFPPGPITAPINSLSIMSFSILGAWDFTSGLAASIAAYIASRICNLPLRACSNASRITSMLNPSTLISICTPQIPSRVPVTLKSISPRWSSSPKISVSIAYLLSLALVIKPMATPLTCFGMGTPASINASEPAQTVAIDDEPLLSKISLTTRTVYGYSLPGIICFKLRIARLPWPTSLLPGPRIGFTSPVEKGGKL